MVLDKILVPTHAERISKLISSEICTVKKLTF